MSTKNPTVREFVKLLKEAGACDKGVASFTRKRGSVKQRLKKMCEVANKPNQHDEDGYLRWLYYRPHLGAFVYRNTAGLWRTYD